MHGRLLHYHIIILKLLNQSIDKVEETDSETLTLQMSWMSLSANGTLIVFSSALRNTTKIADSLFVKDLGVIVDGYVSLLIRDYTDWTYRHS